MSDLSRFSFSFSYQQQPNRPSKPDSYAFGDCREYPLPGNRVLLHNRFNDSKVVVDHEVLYTLRLCDRFRSLEAQQQRIGRHLPALATHPEESRRVLRTLADQGVLISAQALLERLGHGKEATVPKPAVRFCITTCDRPEALERLLHSLRRNRAEGDETELWVIDDSRSQDNQRRNRALVAACERPNWHYFGTEEQQAHLQGFIDALPELEEELQFLFGRFPEAERASHGRARNWALALSSGAHLIQLDDDILFQRCRHPSAEETLRLTSLPREADFYRDTEALEALYDHQGPDPSQGLLREALGCSLAELLGRFPQAAHEPATLARLAGAEVPFLDADSRILVTSCGYLGDPGTKSNDWLYLLNDASRRRLTRSEGEYRHHLQARNLWLGSDGIHLVSHFALMAGLSGLANDHLLPPYFPLFRNEDYLFGRLVKFLHPKALLMDLPWAVPHLPSKPRRWEHRAPRAVRHGLLDFLADQLLPQGQALELAAPQRRLEALAHRLRELAELPENAFSQRLEEAALALRTQHVQQLHQRLEEASDAPDYWRDDLRALIEANQRALVQSQSALPVELEEDPHPLRTAQGLIARYADAVAAWPHIRRVAEASFTN